MRARNLVLTVAMLGFACASSSAMAADVKHEQGGMMNGQRQDVTAPQDDRNDHPRLLPGMTRTLGGRGGPHYWIYHMGSSSFKWHMYSSQFPALRR